jgi:hypothetical protein
VRESEGKGRKEGRGGYAFDGGIIMDAQTASLV